MLGLPTIQNSKGTFVTTSATHSTLAIDGGTPARAMPTGDVFPGSVLIDEEEEAALLDVLRSRRLYRYHDTGDGASKTDQLEQNFAAHINVPHALAVNSGTSALICGLQGVGIGPGDEVIVPAYTWMATATAVMVLGGIPIVAEVDETLTLDPADVEAKITPYTKAMIAVHMRGVPCRMQELVDIAQRHSLKIVEDCAQAIGGRYAGQRLGSFGDIGCFSLQLSKIITSGEGGMVTAKDETIWKRAIQFHDVPAAQRNGLTPEETVWGINFRMSELSAAVALVQLTRLDGLLEMLHARKQMLKAGMADLINRKGLRFRTLPDDAGDTATTLTFFLDTAEQSTRIVDALRAENIGAEQLYRPERTDHHVYAYWQGMIEQRTWTPEGGPWRWAKREITYDREMCPQSLTLLGRAVQMNVDPFMDNNAVEETLDGINRVLEALA